MHCKGSNPNVQGTVYTVKAKSNSSKTLPGEPPGKQMQMTRKGRSHLQGQLEANVLELEHNGKKTEWGIDTKHSELVPTLNNVHAD